MLQKGLKAKIFWFLFIYDNVTPILNKNNIFVQNATFLKKLLENLT